MAKYKAHIFLVFSWNDISSFLCFLSSVSTVSIRGLFFMVFHPPENLFLLSVYRLHLPIWVTHKRMKRKRKRNFHHMCQFSLLPSRIVFHSFSSVYWVKSGKLQAEGAYYKGIYLKWDIPPDEHLPNLKWRLYIFKDDKLAEGSSFFQQ